MAAVVELPGASSRNAATNPAAAACARGAPTSKVQNRSPGTVASPASASRCYARSAPSIPSSMTVCISSPAVSMCPASSTLGANAIEPAP